MMPSNHNRKDNHKGKRNPQRGVVLLMGLVFLVIISMISLYGMRTSSIQEKITSNQRNKTISLMAAEYGANFIVSKIDDKTCKLSSLTACTATDPIRVSNQTNYNAYWSTEGSPTISGNSITFTVLGSVRDGSGAGSTLLSRSKIVFTVQVPVEGRVIEAGGGVKVENGFLKITGGGYAKNAWEAEQSGNIVTDGKLLSMNAFDKFTYSDRSQLEVVTQEIPEPSKVEQVYASQLTGSFETNCTFSANQNLNGQTRKCVSATFAGPVTNGTIVVQSDVTLNSTNVLTGITLITTGKITISGAFNSIGSAENRTTLAAQGDIVAQSIGSGQTMTINGDFRSNGNILLEGSTGSLVKINGQFRSVGNVLSNGNLEIANPIASPVTKILLWREAI